MADEKRILERAAEVDALPVQEVKLITTKDALEFYAELLKRAVRTSMLQIEDWRRELIFVEEELAKYAP